MPPLLCRILKLRESSSEQVLNDKEQKGVRVNIFLLAASKSYPFANVSIYTGLWQVYTGTNSSLLPKMTFILKMTKFTIFSNAKGKYFSLHKVSFIAPAGFLALEG